MARDPSPARLLFALTRASRASGRVLMRHFGRKLDISEKKGAGLVTNADFESEAICKKMLRKSRPDFGFLTEESQPENEGSDGRWIVDPLDGTTNYVHGFPMFCISAAAEWKSEIVAAAIYHPVLKDMYTAIRGKGAFLNGKRIHVSSTKRLRDSLLTTGFTYRRKEWLAAEMDAFERLSGTARAVRRPGSAALDLAYVARGVFDAFWERGLAPWDVAAGMLIVREAGGRVTDFKGLPFQVDHLELLASNPALHKQVLDTIAPESCPFPSRS